MLRKLLYVIAPITVLVAGVVFFKGRKEGAVVEAYRTDEGAVPIAAEVAIGKPADADGDLIPSVEFSAESCPEHLKPLFGLGESMGYVQRKRIVQALGKQLSFAEIGILHAYLYLKPKDVKLDQNGYDALGDVIMLKLEEQEPLPPEYVDHLAAVYSDASRHINWRDYCIQHLGTTYPRTTPEQQAMIRRVLKLAVEEPQLAGTAILAMKNAGLNQSLISDQSMKVAAGKNYPDASRLSALHAAADAGHPDALNLARDVAESKQTVHFRMAAMAVIGKLGDASDLPMLGKYTSSSDIRLREASKAALANIKKRYTK